MRGFETKELLARSRFMQHSDPTGATYLRSDAMIAALSEGWRDAASGVYEAPPPFADEALLLHWWDCGQRRYAAWQADRSDCVHCNDGSGLPCGYHG